MKKKMCVMFLLMGVLFSSGCTRKAELVVVVQEPESPEVVPVLSVPFVSIFDNYFDTGDTSGFAECVGKIVTYEERRKVSEKYSTAGYAVTFRESRNDVTSGKNILYTDIGIRRADGLSDIKILDITSLEAQKGYYLHPTVLREIDPENPGYFNLVSNSVGVLEYKYSHDVIPYGNVIPYDTRIVPKWIVTASEEGKISITEPVDDSKFVYFPNGPE